jgi:hypothetical protein
MLVDMMATATKGGPGLCPPPPGALRRRPVHRPAADLSLIVADLSLICR